MCLLPNSGSFGMSVSTAMIFGLLALMFLDTAINMAMQPFKMLVGDMVNEKQKTQASSIQSFLCNAGSFVFTFMGVANTASKGVVPDSVIYSFYEGAGIIVLCVIYTVVRVKEWPPHEYEMYNGQRQAVDEKEKSSSNWFVLLKNAPSTFWHVGLVQFFCWFAMVYMWAYSTGTVALNCWGTTDTASAAYQEAANWVGILFAVQAIGSVLWAAMLPNIRNRKTAYALSLVLGAIGFMMVPYVTDKYLMFVPFVLIGCAWAATLAMPFTFVTNALEGKGHMGAYLGLFNGTICVPQIIAAALGGTVLPLLGSVQSNMILAAGVMLFVGTLCVWFIKDKEQ